MKNAYTPVCTTSRKVKCITTQIEAAVLLGLTAILSPPQFLSLQGLSRVYWQFLSLEGLLAVFVTRRLTGSFCHSTAYWQFLSLEFFVCFCFLISFCHSKVYWQFLSLKGLLAFSVTAGFTGSLGQSRVYCQFL